MATTHEQSSNPIALILIAGACVLGGGLLGALTNAINGAVSPEYFRNIMRWDDVQSIWRASIAQGIFEGLIYGTLFAVVFTLVVGLVSRARCPFAFAGRQLLVILASLLGCWAAGGVLAMGLATLSPEFYRNAFIGVPDAFGPMLRYAWVGGSIWGAMFGGLLAAVIGSIVFAAKWRRANAEGATAAV
ncbi:MAG: hypothetical protein AAGJ46_16835 [Planctomycetota bacterium]